MDTEATNRLVLLLHHTAGELCHPPRASQACQGQTGRHQISPNCTAGDTLILPGLENSLDKIADKIGDGPQRMF
jgi:hypothetical protein